MAVNVVIEWDDAQALASIRRAIDAIGDPARVLGNIGQQLVNSTKDRFTTETDPDGLPWEALKPRYARAKARKYPGQGILRRENRLYESIVSQVDGDTLLVGTNVTNKGFPYSASMQLGAPSRNVPARPFLGVSAEDRNDIQAIVMDYLRNAVAGD